MDKTKSESVTKEVTTEEEKVDDLLNTFNSQLKIEQKTADQKVNNRFKPYKSKKRKRKSLSLKETPVPEKTPSTVFKNCSVESRSTEFSTEDLPPSYEEEINVNELCAYLENAELIPRKMSSMAQSIYG